MRTRPMMAVLLALLILPAVHVASPSVMPASAAPAPVEGCTSGSITVERGVVGYEWMTGEHPSSQFESDVNGPVFGGGLRYTRVMFQADALDADCVWTVPVGVTRGQLLVVGGGGAGGTLLGGGGGGGGVFYGKLPVNSTLGAVFSPGAVLEVKVGAGGVVAPASCSGAACSGGQGGVSSVAVGGNVIVSAGGGGGGGGAGQSAPAIAGGPVSSGGGGGGGALTDDGTALTSGASGAVGSIANDPYRAGTVGGLLGGTGGAGGGGTAAGSTRLSGGGAGPKGVLPDQINAGVGSVGVTIAFTQGATRFGAGGGGMERGVPNVGEFNFISKPSGSPSSGGKGGLSEVSPAGAGVDGTGGGGGGGGFAGPLSSLGGRGGDGVVMIVYPDPIDVAGPATLDAVRGTAATSTAYSFTFGNETLATTWGVQRVGGGTLTGVSVDMSRRLVASASTPVGEHQLEVIATNTIGTVGVRAVTLTVARAAQGAVSFATTAPTAARVGVGSYTPQLTGGSGTGAYVLTIDAGLAGVCTLDAGIVSFIGEGSCTVWGLRAADADFEPSSSVTQTFLVGARAAQAAVEFSTVAPVGAAVGDAGYLPAFSGGSGSGPFDLMSGSPEVCSVAVSGVGWLVSHLAAGTCSLSVVRDGDDDHLASEATVQVYAVGAPEVVLGDGSEQQETLALSASVDGFRVTLMWTTPADAAFVDVEVCEDKDGGTCASLARWLDAGLQASRPDLAAGALGAILLADRPSTIAATSGVAPAVDFTADGPQATVLGCGQLTFTVLVLRPTEVVEQRWIGDLGPVSEAVGVLLPCAEEVSVERSSGTSSRTVGCSPSIPAAGVAVTCRLAGGAAGTEVQWRASYNPTFADGTIVLDASGEGGFSFFVPVEALGSPLVLEVVGWGGPVVLSQRVAQGVAGPVPTGIPAGGGPSTPFASPSASTALLLMLCLLARSRGREVSPRRR